MGMRNLSRDTNGIVFTLGSILLTAIVLGGIAITAVGVYQLTQKPNITYNITDTGFSLAGLSTDSLTIIAIIIIIVIILIVSFRRKPKEE